MWRVLACDGPTAAPSIMVLAASAAVMAMMVRLIEFVNMVNPFFLAGRAFAVRAAVYS